MVTQTNAQTALSVRLEYTNLEIVAKVLTRDNFDTTTITPDQITGYSLQSLEHGIIWYRVGSGAIPISVDQFDLYWQQIQASQPAPEEPEYMIAFSYDKEDGTQVDVVMKVEDSLMDCRHCWVQEEDLDGEPVFCLETSNGKVVRSDWGTTKNNRWLNAYRCLWTERNNERVAKLEAIARQKVDEEEIAFVRGLEAAMY